MSNALPAGDSGHAEGSGQAGGWPGRSITARRVGFDYRTTPIPRHFVRLRDRDEPDPVMSTVIAVLSALFPEGEDYFVRSVRAYRDELDDAVLKRQVAGFIGQEAMHGREHREFNERLGELGYPVRAVDRTVWAMAKLSEALPGRSRRLAATAAFEHYTATLAELLMGREDVRSLLDATEVRNLFLWHALEESEHKTVAFDVFMAVSGNERIRRITMNVVTAWFLAMIVGWTAVSLLTDRETYRHPRRVLRGVAELRGSPLLSREVVRRIRDYNRRGFHPDDHDAGELLTEWRQHLFGDTGTLTDRVKRADAIPA